MNWYFESFIDKLETAQSQEQAKQLMDLCCEGKNPKGEKVARGCIHCVNCDETRCPVWRQYQVRLIILDKSTIARQSKTQSYIVHTRKYKIKPKTQCKRTVCSQITKLSKKLDSQSVLILSQIKEHVENERFKRALNLAKKNNLISIVDTLNIYISGLAAKRENK